MKKITKKMLKYALTIGLIVLYLNILAYLVPFFDLEYTVMEFVFIFVAVILAVITSEFIFRTIMKAS
ncbi:hypothetical protein [Sutcliffiella horikoshii]|uniref:hypothetical protein n=1 Tax=Sutcliffiella horikoshii TaxID=79883 RepID=UPI003CF99154